MDYSRVGEQKNFKFDNKNNAFIKLKAMDFDGKKLTVKSVVLFRFKDNNLLQLVMGRK